MIRVRTARVNVDVPPRDLRMTIEIALVTAEHEEVVADVVCNGARASAPNGARHRAGRGRVVGRARLQMSREQCQEVVTKRELEKRVPEELRRRDSYKN